MSGVATRSAPLPAPRPRPDASGTRLLRKWFRSTHHSIEAMTTGSGPAPPHREAPGRRRLVSYFCTPYDPADPVAGPGQLRGGFLTDNDEPTGHHYGALNTEPRMASYLGTRTVPCPPTTTGTCRAPCSPGPWAGPQTTERECTLTA
jgi:hypothetical protein